MAREFEALALNGHNYPTWAMDTKIALASRGIVRAIQAEQDPLPAGVTPLTDEQKYTALYIIRHHIHPDLKSDYLEEESPSTLFRGPQNEAEKHDELLAKNGSQRPVGSQPLPEVHMNVANGRKFDGGFKGKPSNFNGKRKRNRNRKPRNSDRGKGTAKSKFDKSKLCDKCGCYMHPTDKCKTPRHLAILYQQSHGRNAPRGKRFEANFNLHPDGTDGAGCSQDVPSGPSNAVTLLPSKDPAGTEDMMVEYTSTDVFGDFD
nr:uncharacterized protein LOC127310760 [Lolium perenne]